MSAPLTDTFELIVNNLPVQTGVGTAYVFADMDPFCSGCTTYFDDTFPWIVDDYLEILEEDTALWWTEIDEDTLIYQLTMSDGTDRPAWMSYTVDTGYFKGWPHLDDASSYMNLRFTLTDENGGSHSFHKTLLVNSEPATTKSYVTIRVNTDKEFGFSLKEYFYDYDGDWLTFEMTDAAQITSLNTADIFFYNRDAIVAGKPKTIGYHKQNVVVATDPHGATTTLYFTVVVTEENYPVRRSEVEQLED